MARTFYIIDGYNLAHAAGLMPPGGLPVETWVVRDQLVMLIADFLSTAQRNDTTIVFDVGPNNSSVPVATTQSGLHLLFAVDEPDADTLIEKLVQQHHSPRQIVIISSDRRVQAAAKRRKGKSLSSPEFLRLLARQAGRSGKSRGENRNLTVPSGEVDQWLEWFGMTEDERPSVESEDATEQSPAQQQPQPFQTPAVAEHKQSAKPPRPRPNQSKQNTRQGQPAKQTFAKKFRKQPTKNSPTAKQEGERKSVCNEPLSADELSFWTSRLSDLLQDSDNQEA